MHCSFHRCRYFCPSVIHSCVQLTFKNSVTLASAFENDENLSPNLILVSAMLRRCLQS